MGTAGETNHWNIPDLKLALEDECGDLLAAIRFVTEKCGLDFQRITKRAADKLAIFNKWHRGENVPR